MHVLSFWTEMLHYFLVKSHELVAHSINTPLALQRFSLLLLSARNVLSEYFLVQGARNLGAEESKGPCL